ncbi:hypothetical protein BpHYR1_037768 [Brachionus plicatilis]|uniref:Uncharacterized protein n=1 Tax=Brachionus plicatilis TaxID=10195 RepID=A0A3M7RAZ6_BRAPC|nr:hypothetical protein BpHYR1_037768 [Brachionus plicatilis]
MKNYFSMFMLVCFMAHMAMANPNPRLREILAKNNNFGIDFKQMHELISIKNQLEQYKKTNVKPTDEQMEKLLQSVNTIIKDNPLMKPFSGKIQQQIEKLKQSSN